MFERNHQIFANHRLKNRQPQVCHRFPPMIGNSDISIHLKFGGHFQPAESTVLSNKTLEKGRVTDETVA